MNMKNMPEQAINLTPTELRMVIEKGVANGMARVLVFSFLLVAVSYAAKVLVAVYGV